VRLALGAVWGEKTMAEIAAHHELYAKNHVTTWKRQALKQIRQLHEKVGELTMDRDF
jgi:hypothetical protein